MEKEIKGLDSEKSLEVEDKEKVYSHQNKVLKQIFVWIGAFVFLILIGMFFINSVKHFDYKGVSGEVVKEGNLILYQTSVPVIYQGEKIPYNFYLRNDPNKLDKIPFEGELNILPNMVLESKEDFSCDGMGTIGIANLNNLYGVIGTKVIKDETASCDSEGKYMFVTLSSGEENKIEQFGPACYNLIIKDCDVLDVTERFMAETFVQIQSWF